MQRKISENAGAFGDLARVLELSGNEVRLKILYLLEEEGKLCPCDLSDILGMSVPAVSQHLRKLKDGNVIQSRRVGQTIFYSLTDGHLKILRPFFDTLTFEEPLQVDVIITLKMETKVIAVSTITCPACSFSKEEEMPTDACQYFYECENCKTLLKPKPGNCCVFCSYGNVKCPPVQLEKACCK